MLAAGEPDMPPLMISGGIADQMGAIMLAYGVLAALVARERFGVGQEVDASHLGSMLMLQGLSVAARLMMGFAIPRVPRKFAANPLWNHYRCGDDKWICLGMLQPDRYWADFCRALGRAELAQDERFCNLRVRAANAAAAIDILDEIFATKPREEWMRILRSSGDFIFTIVNSVDDLRRSTGGGKRLHHRFRPPAIRQDAGGRHPGALERDAGRGAPACARVRPAYRGTPEPTAGVQLGPNRRTEGSGSDLIPRSGRAFLCLGARSPCARLSSARPRGR